VTDSLLRVENLVTSFRTERGTIRAVDGISFEVKKGQTVGLVGESGCGKSVTSLSILRLIQSPPGKIESGAIKLGDKNLLELSDAEMRGIRGNRVSMIFQEPMTSLNPVFTIGNQISEVFRIHQGASKKEARERSIEMLRLVKIPAPEQRVDEYPHQLSGGMRQRVMIAMALACRPELLIADEPTTALDVTIQAQILDLMAQLQTELNMAILLITHDLGVVAEVCDYVIVMYAGKIAEQGTVEQLFREPRHPYTAGLLKSIPRLGHKTKVLPTIEGQVPSLAHLPVGCRFQTRCPFVHDRCRREEPPLLEVGPERRAACWLNVEKARPDLLKS
jgi:oligopeptide/dipeptide ABC transporter ATP-binding protein